MRAPNQTLANTSPLLITKSQEARKVNHWFKTLRRNPYKDAFCGMWNTSQLKRKRNHKAPEYSETVTFSRNRLKTQFLFSGAWLVLLFLKGEKVNKSWKHLYNSSTGSSAISDTHKGKEQHSKNMCWGIITLHIPKQFPFNSLHKLYNVVKIIIIWYLEQFFWN